MALKKNFRAVILHPAAGKAAPMSQDRKTLFTSISIAFLITGNLIGAGILALPVATGLAGFIPSLLVMIVVGGSMYFSAAILSKEAVLEKAHTFNYPSLYHKYLGTIGKWTAILANLLILYGLLTAYLSGATSIISNLIGASIPTWAILLTFFAFMTWLSISEMRIIKKYNVLLIIMMWLSFGLIVAISGSNIEPSRLRYMDWEFAAVTVPIVITSFHFHNIIPQVCENLDWNISRILKAMLAGMLIGYLMNAIWMMVGIGSIPLAEGENSILAAFQANLPATVPLSKILDSAIFVTGAAIFALLAIATSYLANGLALLGFFDDLVENHFKIHSRTLKVVLAFAPPLAVSLFYPSIFLKTVDLVGGVGIAMLFGILPCIIAYKKFAGSRVAKIFISVILIIFTCTLGFEIMEKFGRMNIKPHIQNWSTHLHGK